MANRFFDSEKFKDKWYRNLTPKQKCMWEYFISECNIAGILEIDLPLMSLCINEEISMKDFETFENKIIWLKEDLIYIPNFILFQQKISSIEELNEKNNAHKGILKELLKYNIDSNFKAPLMPLIRGIGKGIGKGKGKGKGKYNEEEKILKKYGEFQNVFLSDEEADKLKDLYKTKFNDAIDILSNYLQSKGKEYKDYYAVLRKNNWVYEKVMKDNAVVIQEQKQAEKEEEEVYNYGIG